MSELQELAAERSAAPNSTIDAICATLAVKPDLIKIDVEGAEYSVLQGASHTVRESLPAIQVELHSFPPTTMRQNAEHILKWAIDHGYSMWYLATGAVLRDVSPLVSRGRCHVLLLPAGQPYPEPLSQIVQGGALNAR